MSVTRYLLEGWRKDLDTKILEEFRKVTGDDFKKKVNRNEAVRTIWYHVSRFLDELIKSAAMEEAFRPFAISYMREHIEAQVDSHNLYCGPE